MTEALRQAVLDCAIDPHTNALRTNIIGDRQQNAGLELDRYLLRHGQQQPDGEQQSPERTALLNRVARSSVPIGYAAAYHRWEAALGTLPGAESRIYRVNGRMIVGLGAESVLESSITLNRTWGVPYIPGTALKGLAAHYLNDVLADGDPDLVRQDDLELDDHGRAPTPNVHGVLFGTGVRASYVNWLDAWFIPGNTTDSQSPFLPDVITPHHPGYYQKSARIPQPTDADDPNPIPFVSAGGIYLACLQGPDQRWVDFAFRLLTEALEHAGIGAKTHAGYGRLVPGTTA